jgi:trk system potassium uptake protein TrkH
MILVGMLLLSLPVSAQDAQATNLLDALFTAASAVCVTGLVVVDTGTYWSPFGQAVILVLMQAGGLGFMVSSTLLLVLLGHRTSLRERLRLGEAIGGSPLGDVLRLVRRVALTAFGIEALGALLLAVRFAAELPLGQALWWGVFHSVSAFTNASFDLTGGFRSLTPYRHDAWILLTISVLIVMGGVGFAALADLAGRRSWRRLTVDTKVVLSLTVALLIGGAAMILALEWSNPATLGALSWPDRLLNAFFHSVVPRSAGFNSLPVGEFRQQTLFVTMALIFIGAASGSTGGGIKVQTFALLLLAILASARSREQIVAYGRAVPNAQVFRALAVAALSIAVIFTVALVLTITEPFPFLHVLFETVSAFGTDGLTTGMTPDLSVWGRAILSLTMFVGRLGPLTLVLALAARTDRSALRFPQETVRIG